MQSRMEWNTTVVKSLFELPYLHALLLFILVAAISALLLWKAFFGRTTQWPPGPPAWPIIGHLHLLGELPHQSLCKLSQSFGPLMGLRLGAVPTIVASTQEMAKAILQTHDLAFAYRPRLAGAVHLCFDCTDVGFAPYGPYWKFLRQIYASELFSPKRLDASKHVREEEVRTLRRAVLERGDEGIELRPSLVMASNNINCRMAMGKRITEISARMGGDEGSKLDLVSLIDEVLHLLGVFYVGDFIPWLAWLDPHGYLKRMKAVGQKTKLIMQDMINKRRDQSQHERQEGAPQDLLDVLLAASQNKDLHQDVTFTDDNIMAALLDLFIGGSDTSAVTVEWALADLVSNPGVMEKVHQELDGVVGRERLVEEGDISNLAYLGSVVTESMRLHPSVPLLLPREAIQECHIGGYKIPAKSRAFINTWALGRDAATWERPLDFWPERFDAKKMDLRGQIFEMLAFGLGRRRCPGWALGLLNSHFMLATLVQGFTWSLEPPSSPNYGSYTHVLDMSERFGLTVSMAKPLHAFATPRLPLHLY